jgi:quercetin dioxygenase-like cupin family protein
MSVGCGRLRAPAHTGSGRDGWCAVGGYIRAANEGDAYDWRGARVVIKASGDDTFGQLGVMESTYPPGLSVPAHTHTGEDEMFYLLDGELRGFCDDDRWTATPGSFVFVPRDRPHGFVVTSDGPARALVIVGPSRLDRQVVANGTPVPGPSVTPHPRR